MSPNEVGVYKIIFKSEYQLYEFNFPYQLAVYSDGEGDTESLKNIGKNTQKKLILKSGDVVLLMTDGVFDNLFDIELEKITNSLMLNVKPAQELAESIGHSAKNRSLQYHANTPFIEGAKMCGKEFYGGKIDDITVVVAIMN